MKNKIFATIVFSICLFQLATAQNYSQSVEDFVEGKYFKNSQTGLRLKYGYISSLNTYGLTFKNSYGNEFYFMNCSQEFSSDRQYMELTNCMRPTDGSGVGIVKVFKDKIIVSNSDGNLTYYLENNGSNSFESKSINSTVGKTKIIGNLEIAPTDFPQMLGIGSAKESCENLGEGWRLPTKNEMTIMYKNRVKIGGFNNEFYWCGDDRDYFVQDFKSGKQERLNGMSVISDKYKLRAVRNIK